MKKITSLLMMFMLFVGMGWAQGFVPKEGNSYLIKNVAKGRYALHNVNCKDTNGNMILSHWDKYDERSWFVIAKHGEDFVIRMANNEKNHVYAVNTNSEDYNVGVKEVADLSKIANDCLWQIVDKGNGQWNIIPKGGSNSWNCRGNLGGNACIGQWDHNDENDNKWNIISDEDLYNEAKTQAQAALENESKSPYVWKKTSGVAAVNAALQLPSDTWQNRLKAMDALNAAVANFNKNVSVPTDKSFLLLNRLHNNYMSVDDTKANLVSSNKEVNSKWTFVNAENGKYKIFNALANKYVAGLPSKNNTETTLTDAANAGLYTLEVIEKEGEEYLLMKDEKQNPSYIHSSNGKMVRWNGDINCDASMWSLKNQSVQVTYNYLIDGVQFISKTVTQYEGDALHAVDLNNPFISEYQLAEGVVTSGMQPVEVTCVEALPFQKSTDVENAKWFVVDIHSNQATYYWTVQDNHPVIRKMPSREDVSVMNNPAYHWCFIGNVYDGFKIVNQQTGQALNSVFPCEFVALTEGAKWKLAKSTQIEGGTAFTVDGTNYINKQSRDDVKDPNLFGFQSWTQADAGSSCRFFTDQQVQNMANKAKEDKVNDLIARAEVIPAAPKGYVGTSPYLAVAENAQSFADALAALKANKMDDAVFATMQAEYDKANKLIELVNGGLYRLKNVKRVNTGTLTVGADGVLTNEAYNTQNINNVWKLNKLANNKYNLVNANFGKSASAPGEHKLVDNPAEYELVVREGAQFSFKSGQFLVQYSDEVNKIGTWSSAEKDGDGSWYIIPATDLEVNLATVGENAYTSLYLPFAVSMPNNVEAYTATKVADKNALTMHLQNEVPANQGMVLKAAADVNKVILNVLPTTSVVLDGNALVGTNVAKPITAEQKTSIWVLGNKNGHVGFYRPSENLNTLAANKAYVELPAGTSVNGFVLDFGETTGVESVEAETPAAQQVIFDLSGRRVAKMTKGLYIVNGKKVLVK